VFLIGLMEDHPVSLGFHPDAAACIRIDPGSGAKQLLCAIPNLLACDSASGRKRETTGVT